MPSRFFQRLSRLTSVEEVVMHSLGGLVISTKFSGSNFTDIKRHASASKMASFTSPPPSNPRWYQASESWGSTSKAFWKHAVSENFSSLTHPPPMIPKLYHTLASWVGWMRFAICDLRFAICLDADGKNKWPKNYIFSQRVGFFDGDFPW